MNGVSCFPLLEENYLPERTRARIVDLISTGRICAADISDVRLRVGRPASVTCQGNNIVIDECLLQRELDECVARLCRGSVYAHSDTIREGYIRMDDGLRVGVCGELAADGRGIARITSLNIRIPHIIRGVCEGMISCFFDSPTISSVLIYSPPGVGKTTLLRDIALTLGERFSRRVAVIDTRGELYIEKMFSRTLCDFLLGYPRASGIEIATRTLSPEAIICDEIGDSDEAHGILAAQNTGVPIIASAHASSLSELLTRPNIRVLHDSRIFCGYVGISREIINGRMTRSFRFKYTSWESAEESLND